MVTSTDSAATTNGPSGDGFHDYVAWNRAIASFYFDAPRVGAAVYLDVDDETLQELARLAGADDDFFGQFTRSVTATLHLESGTGVFNRHVEWLEEWQTDPRGEAPPCLALLAVFVLAAERMRDDANFSGSAYYARLAEVAGLDPTDVDARKRLERHFRDDSERFWDALNAWILRAGGRRGVPSAVALDTRRYVSVPISQALVRHRDRQRFSDLFESEALAPGESVSRGEMRSMLAGWIPHSRLTPTLKQMWAKSDDLKDRITEVALLELATWPGPVDAAEDPDRPPIVRKQPLVLTAFVSRHPAPTLHLGLAVPASGRAEATYALPDDATEGLVASFQECEMPLPFEAASEQWLRVQAYAVRYPDLLQSVVRLVETDSGREASRVPARVTMLREDEPGFFVETERVALGERHLVLAHRSLAQAVADYLAEAAADGFARSSPAQLRNAPVDWEVFTNVRIVNEVYTTDTDLARLMPRSPASIQVEGGLKLSGLQTWHRGAPPMVVGAIAGGPSGELRLTRSAGAEDSTHLSATLDEGAAALTLDPNDMADGEYMVELRGAKGTVDSRRFRLVSASDHQDSALGLLGFAFPPPGATEALSAVPVEPLAAVVRGALVPWTPERVADAVELPPQPTGFVQSGDGATDDVEPEAFVEALHKVGVSCLDSGSHHFVLTESDHPGYWRPEQGECKWCGLRKWFRPKPKSQFQKAPKKAVPTTVVVSQTSSDQWQGDGDSAPAWATDFGLLLDALSYEQGGSWSLFERIARQFDDSALFAHRTAHALSALGHVDFTKTASQRLGEWRVAPPTLVVGEPGCVFLAGERSADLLERLESAVQALDGRLASHPQDSAPPSLAVEGLSEEALELVVDEVGLGPSGVQLSVVAAAGTALACSLPSLAGLLDGLTPRPRPVQGRLEWYDAASNRWVPGTAPGRTVAIRERGTQPWTGLAVGDHAFLLDGRVTKHLAGALTGAPLLGYEDGMLVVPLGAELPGLYERAAVLCSGRMPVKYTDGTLRYADVPAAVAAHLWRCLMGKES